MAQTIRQAFVQNFLGRSPDWYKLAIIGFLAKATAIEVISSTRLVCSAASASGIKGSCEVSAQAKPS